MPNCRSTRSRCAPTAAVWETVGASLLPLARRIVAEAARKGSGHPRSRSASRSTFALAPSPSCSRRSWSPARVSRRQRPAHPRPGEGGMVVSTHHAAAAAGARILDAGGNAIDAAVATAFAVGVVPSPSRPGVGGGAFALVRLEDGTIRALDARETAPAASTPTMYIGSGRARSAHRSTGRSRSRRRRSCRGWWSCLKRHGTMSLAEVLAPAIDLAENGRRDRALPRAHGGLHAKATSTEERFPETWRIQFAPFDPATMRGEKPRPEGPGRSRFEIARPATGRASSATGPSGRAMASKRSKRQRWDPDPRRPEAPSEPTWREPVLGTYRGHRVASFPPPSSGGAVLVQALNVLEGLRARGGMRAGRRAGPCIS